MPQVVPMSAEMFPEVCDSLLGELDPAMPASRWARCFDGRWGDGPVGYVLLDGGRPVGLLGTLFSEHVRAGTTHRLCNLHSWYVRPEHRAASLLLLRPLLALRECTLTDLSATPRVVEIAQRLGFRSLDTHMWVFPRWGLPRASDGVRLLRLDAASAAERLSPADLKRYRDHQETDCEHWWLAEEGEDRYCYLATTRHPLGRIPHCRVHYLSDPGLFLRHEVRLRRPLTDGGLRCITACARWLERGPRPAQVWSVRTNRKLFRPAALPPEEIDHLYSELPLLGLPAEFACLTRLGTRLRRLRGQAERA